jgi:hypothetical protein
MIIKLKTTWGHRLFRKNVQAQIPQHGGWSCLAVGELPMQTGIRENATFRRHKTSRVGCVKLAPTHRVLNAVAARSNEFPDPVETAD